MSTCPGVTARCMYLRMFVWPLSSLCLMPIIQCPALSQVTSVAPSNGQFALPRPRPRARSRLCSHSPVNPGCQLLWQHCITTALLCFDANLACRPVIVTLKRPLSDITRTNELWGTAAWSRHSLALLHHVIRQLRLRHRGHVRSSPHPHGLRWDRTWKTMLEV